MRIINKNEVVPKTEVVLVNENEALEVYVQKLDCAAERNSEYSHHVEFTADPKGGTKLDKSYKTIAHAISTTDVEAIEELVASETEIKVGKDGVFSALDKSGLAVAVSVNPKEETSKKTTKK